MNEIVEYQAQQQAEPQDIVDVLTTISSRGPLAVANFTAAFERMPEDMRRVYVARQYHNVNVAKADVGLLYGDGTKQIEVMIRDKNGDPFVLDGKIQYERVTVETPMAKLLSVIQTPLEP